MNAQHNSLASCHTPSNNLMDGFRSPSMRMVIGNEVPEKLAS